MLCRPCRWSPLAQMLCCRECHDRSSLWILCHRGCLRFFPGGCLAVSGILGGCFATVGSLVPSLVDALLPRACGPSSGHLVFVGGCFAAGAARCSYALSGWMLCHCRLRCRFWVLRAVVLLSFFFLFLYLFQVTHHSLAWWFINCATRVLS
jgi:hypothetical protein